MEQWAIKIFGKKALVNYHRFAKFAKAFTAKVFFCTVVEILLNNHNFSGVMDLLVVWTVHRWCICTQVLDNWWGKWNDGLVVLSNLYWAKEPLQVNAWCTCNALIFWHAYELKRVYSYVVHNITYCCICKCVSCCCEMLINYANSKFTIDWLCTDRGLWKCQV